MSKIIASGVVHKVPTDIRRALMSSVKARDIWNNLTPLARNEWICWTISVKGHITRENHVERLCDDLTKGKRRPCCWPGCPHRQNSPKIH